VNITLPPGQQLVAPGKWPLVGERLPAEDDTPWSVAVGGQAERSQLLSLERLFALPQVEQVIDIHCVTRWSKLGVRCRGVSLATVLKLVTPQSDAQYVSFVARSTRRHSTSLPLQTALDLETILALEVEGTALPSEHGGPVRVVVPGRYFYKSLKWLSEIELLAEDRLGYWEANSGYHNEADPWRQQRYIPGRLTPADAKRVLSARDIRGQDLLGLPATGMALAGLQAQNGLLRDADFRHCNLNSANFEGANLTNAHLEGADARNASFVGADLEGAAFQGADLRGADLRAASLVAATFCDETEDGCTNAARFDSRTRVNLSLLQQLAPLQANYLLKLIPHLPRTG
jgi:DMSO/TMAO reductase YedYZ molybdopterin-dependent catalytic subunit